MDEDAEIDAFLARFREQAPVYLKRRGRNDNMGRVLTWVFGYYRFILRGEVEGRDAPVRVRICA